jgi:hypothetical protein
MFRLRYSSEFDINRPDRAEFIWPSWRELSFHPHGINGNGTYFDPKARGPEALPGELDLQELSAYFELAFNKRFSMFVDVPERFVASRNILEEPDTELRNPNSRNPAERFFPEPRDENTEPAKLAHGGLSDIAAGFKAAFVAEPDRYITFQLRVDVPTGQPGKGLGNGHTTLEPGLLAYRRLGRVELQGQFEDWIPIGGGKNALGDENFAGNILIYGIGLGYDVYERGCLRIVPITEFVGWTVLSGLESIGEGTITATPPPGVILPVHHGVQDASGDTIVNAKVGVRTYFGNGNDVYVGWGHSLTGDRWYRDIIRLEYRRSF